MSAALAMTTDDTEEMEFNLLEADPVDSEIKPNELYKDIRALVTHYIDTFFSDKMFYCGGRIPKRFLHDPNRVTMVINYDISKGVLKAYKSLRSTITNEEVENARRIGDSTSDVKLVNETLKILARSGIPQQFAGGMMIMYLDFVEGVEIL